MLLAYWAAEGLDSKGKENVNQVKMDRKELPRLV